MRPEPALREGFDPRIAALNAGYRDATAQAVVAAALGDAGIGPVALVSSFGAESVVLLHMVARLDPATPVLFLETGMLFAETLAYQGRVAEALRLRDLRVIRAPEERVRATDPLGQLHQADPDACCALRKTEPLAEALGPFGAWLTGRKRFQASTRRDLDAFEADGAGRIKINPLARWSAADVAAYMAEHDLPRHPLVARGYPSIGCAPCTSTTAPGEDPRAGRWRGQGKEECGIHFVAGRAVRAPRGSGL